MRLLGAVLAGGGSRRFGSPKALARLHGAPLWRVAARRLGGVCDDVVAIVNDGEVARAVGLGTIPDRVRPAGPLAGIDAALAHALRGGHDAALVLAVDMPWVTEAALRRLADAWRERGREQDRPCLARTPGEVGVHPLCGVYPVGVLDPLSRALAERRLAAVPFVGSLAPVAVDTGLSADALRGVNRPADLPPPALSIVGNKKAGKTTLAVAVIAELARRGRRVMSVKHGHHFRLDAPGTDSWRHRREGKAGRVLMTGPEGFALVGGWGWEGEPPLDLLLCRHLGGAEIVVVEGFREARVPKVEIHRSAVQPEPVLEPARAKAQGAIAVVTDAPDLPWSAPVLEADAPDVGARVADLAEAALLEGDRVGEGRPGNP